ncbi:MAG: ATP-binding protein [Clostridiales bacterium]|uniref:ATP-binding protein n=1 Tax=Clostridium sp. N3C TaxID=1776758 RepID=UPI00092E1979|nr:ATP-binding protein [Clostridium sp. N3C]NLZ48997.1 ATP-binding protein [Clostridiales bacterium]SCN23276.1 putative ATPase (AAA+ superfamily) [Clostridium sp. N3C]
MFVGRKYELEQLNKLYTRDGFQLVILYGRRKVGKTSLIKEFVKDKDTLYYAMDESNEASAMDNFNKLICNFFNINEESSPIISWEDCLKTIADNCGNKRIVVVLEELSYIGQNNALFLSQLKKAIEFYFKATQIFLIISGSANGFMEKTFLNPKSSLYGLQTAQFKIEPFSFFECSHFFPYLSIEEKIIYYSTLGGIPQYVMQFDYSRDYETNVMEFILNKSSYLFNEPENYLKAQVEDINFANKILSLLSKGDYNLERFHNKNISTGEDLILMIKKLKKLNIISRRRSVGMSIVRPWSFYRLEDNFFRFWYRFVYKNRGLIDMNMIDYLFQNKIKRDLNSHIGYVFEEISTEYLKKLNSEYKLPFVFESIGSWVGYNPVLQKPSQLDIVATSYDSVLVGECKWSQSLTTIDVLENLVLKAETLKYKNKYYCLFSKCGYDKKVLEYVKNKNNFYLFTLKDIDI